ncbi:MAG: hypothetical protein ACF8Q5_00155 [Phycisphaerales bacterium JB040]
MPDSSTSLPSESSDAGTAAGTAQGFSRQASRQIRSVQAALTDLLDQAGVGGARPTTIGRALGLDKTLAWKLARFVEAGDPVHAARHMPGAGGVEIVLKAAAAKGVTESRLESVRSSDLALREFMRRHAGDRRSFEAMLAGNERDEHLELEERRTQYRAGSAIWGVRARTQLLTLALRPSETEDGMLDGLQLGGLLGFERLHEDVPWIVRRFRAHDDSGARLFDVRRETLDPAAPAGMALIPGFCSDPLPPVRQFVGDNGWVYDEIAPGPVGRDAAVDVVSGEIYRAALPYRRADDNTQGRYALTVRTPVELVQFDLLLHRSMGHFDNFVASVYGLLEDRPRSASESRARPLYDPEPATELGDPPKLQTARVSGYASMIERAFELGRWGGLDEFRAFRIELEYPPFPCELLISADINEA